MIARHEPPGSLGRHRPLDRKTVRTRLIFIGRVRRRRASTVGRRTVRPRDRAINRLVVGHLRSPGLFVLAVHAESSGHVALTLLTESA